MTLKFKQLFFLLVSLVIFFSCEVRKGSDSIIIHQPVNKEYVLIRDIQTLQESDDGISNHVDSILSGLINEEFISTGQKDFDLDADQDFDIGFEIIDLNKFNPNGLPESFDSLAARVIPISVEILDNSTYGYPDALENNDEINKNGYWSSKSSVLGTFLNAGQFKGKGDRYLGFRFAEDTLYKYGWIKIYCSQHNDTLRIIEYAYNDLENSEIIAGQKE